MWRIEYLVRRKGEPVGHVLKGTATYPDLKQAVAKLALRLMSLSQWIDLGPEPQAPVRYILEASMEEVLSQSDSSSEEPQKSSRTPKRTK